LLQWLSEDLINLRSSESEVFITFIQHIRIFDENHLQHFF